MFLKPYDSKEQADEFSESLNNDKLSDCIQTESVEKIRINNQVFNILQ